MSREMNRLLREASGRRVEADRPEAVATVRTYPPRVGSIGIGRGGGSAARPRTAPTNALINERIRKGARIVRDVKLGNGIEIDIDNPWL